VWDTGERVGAWRSLVARTVRVGEVPSSNLGAPILFVCEHRRIAANISEQGRTEANRPTERVRSCSVFRTGDVIAFNV
jgi:hypothetical protein